MEILNVQKLCKTYGQGEAQVDALKQVTFTLEKGQFAAVVGESGSGKSTLLHCIGALDTPTSGSIRIDGQDLFAMKEEQRTIFRRRNIGFVFQSFQLVPELDVEQNLIFPLLLDYKRPDPARVEELLREKKSVVIAVSEGITTADGKYVFELAESDSDANADAVDAFGHKQLSGVGKFLADLIAEKLEVKTRAIELNTLQRCAAYMTSRVDVTEAFQVGGAAVKAAFEGESGKVAILKRISEDPYLCITGCEDVHKIANKEKKVPRQWISEDGMNVTEDLIHYIRPLIQAELSPMMVDGLPRHLILR